MTTNKLLLAIVIGSTIIASCNESTSVREQIALTPEDLVNDSLKRATAEKVFYTIPSPIETASILKKSGARFNMDVLNPIKNSDKYVTMKSKALNLGIYGADLSYTAIFDKSQEAMLYLSCTKKLADDLGIVDAFNIDKIERIEANLGNRDSLLVLITDSYFESDAFLKENQKGNVSALMVLGGWIEGLHIASAVEKSLRESKSNEIMLVRISDQRIALENLIELVTVYELDIPEIIQGLNELKTIYNTIEEKEVNSTITVSSGGSSTPTVGKTISLNLTIQQADQIRMKTIEIRNKIIS
ncbi:MAG: hypothetical protein H0V01_13600 [Bacteroidetes bacterium]|nr:hypothetical protein [Bacteroidota bacterium]HET6245445.1 hypothetical protein [Bacteroidia bacterium]